jgi:hypothetical protein
VYTSSKDAHNIKKLPVSIENINGASFSTSKVSGSLGDSTCGTQGNQAPCSGDSEGLGTFARYDTISGLALQVTNDASGTDLALFIADQGNNKIRKLELTSGLFQMTTFDSNVDPYFQPGSGYLAGIAVDSSRGKLYAGVLGAILVYDVASGAGSKALFAGRLPGQGQSLDPLQCK